MLCLYLMLINYAFKLLEERSKTKQVTVSLLIDEMEIKKQIFWDDNENKMCGYDNIGNGICYEI